MKRKQNYEGNQAYIWWNDNLVILVNLRIEQFFSLGHLANLIVTFNHYLTTHNQLTQDVILEIQFRECMCAKKFFNNFLFYQYFVIDGFKQYSPNVTKLKLNVEVDERSIMKIFIYYSNAGMRYINYRSNYQNNLYFVSSKN